MAKANRFLCVLSLFLWILLCGMAQGIGTVAGTDITIGSAEVYHDNRVDYSNTLSIVVSQHCGLGLLTPEAVGSVAPGEACFFPFTLTNVGNGSDVYSFELSDTSPDWSSTLIKDDDSNGVREDSETTPVPNEIMLAEDASYYLFAALYAPAALREEVTGSTRLGVWGRVDDGGTYPGANGLFYGGPDSASCEVFARAVHVDTTPPTISNLVINDRRRFAEDIISSRLKIEARILDDEPENVEKIEIWLNDSLKYEGASPDWKDAYNEENGEFKVELPPLSAGEYTFKIIARDKSGNQAQESISQLYVYSPDDVRVIGKPLNYPNPFAPLKGQKTSIAYVLSTDANITIYLYDIRASALWKRTYKAFEEGAKAGYNEVIWDGYSDFGRVLGNGIYIFKIAHKNRVIGKGKATILDSN